jgi:hypothetical protein
MLLDVEIDVKSWYLVVDTVVYGNFYLFPISLVILLLDIDSNKMISYLASSVRPCFIIDGCFFDVVGRVTNREIIHH